MNLKKYSPISSIKEEINELKRKDNKVENETSNPQKTAKTCLIAAALSFPAGILSAIVHNIPIAVLFFIFGVLSLVFATILFLKAGNSPVIDKTGSTESVQTEHISTREKMKQKQEKENHMQNKKERLT